MGYVDDGFVKLKSNLEITQTEQDTSVRRHTGIRDYVTGRWDLIDDFLTGSYRRDTKTKKLKDIDIFIVINPDGAQVGHRTGPPGDVLDALQALLTDRWSDAYRDGMAVVIPYGNDDEVMSIDVVPAFDRKGEGTASPTRPPGRGSPPTKAAS